MYTETDSIISSEVNFRNLFENSPVGKSMTGRDVIFHVNKAFCDILGYSAEELTTKKLKDITYPEDIQKSGEFLESLSAGKIEQVRFEKRFIHKKGNIVWVEDSTYLQRDQDNQPLFFLTTIIDITERKQAEELLKLNEARLESLLKVNLHPAETIQELLDFTLDEAITLTGSKIGYIYFYDELKKEFTLNTWSREVMHQCTVNEPQTIYRLEETGIWGEAVRQRQPIMINEFDAPNPLKKGLPEGHAPLKKFLTIPVFSKENIVAVVAVANKLADYNDLDIIQLRLMMDAVWRIVQRKQAEEKTQKITKELERFFDLIPDMVCIASSDGFFKTMNQAWTKTLGFSHEELISKSFFEFIHPYDLEATVKEVEKQLKGQRTVKFTNRYLCKNGSYKLLEWEATPAIEGLLYAAARDITERKLAEETLRESEEFNRSLLKTIPFGMDIVDEFGNILFQSENFQKMVGNKVLSQKCWELYRDDQVQCGGCPLIKGIQIGKTDIYESNGVLGGKTFQISHTGMLFHGKKAMLEIFQDITQRKQEEEQLVQLNYRLKELNATKDKLFSIIAHDLKGPFSNILSLSELLNDTLHTDIPKSEIFIEHINSSAKNTLVLLDNLLAWAKTQTGKIKFVPEKLSLRPIIEEIVAMLSSPAKLKNIEVRNLQAEDIMVNVDKNMVDTILRNLIANAIKFTNSGGIINIYAIQDVQYVEIIIQDNGVGMDDKTQKQLFKIDSNVTTMGTANERGSGLGLILCHEFVEKHGGKIWTESEIDKGSKFHFTLPKI